MYVWTVVKSPMSPYIPPGLFGSLQATVAVWPENPFPPLLTRPQGPQGCQMKQNDSLNMPLEVWCAKIDPKLNKLEKTIKNEKKLIKNVCFLKVFQFFFKLGSILAHQTSKSMFS